MFMMKFIGCGSAFNKLEGQSNVVMVAESGKKMLIDCGSYLWTFTKDLAPKDIDAVYVSHLHADHVGGLEELAFCTYFTPGVNRPKLFCNDALMPQLWEETLRGGLESIQGKVVTLTEYFDCHPVPNSSSFRWENIEFTPIQTVHVMAGYHIKYSYGLMMREDSSKTRTVERLEVIQKGMDGMAKTIVTEDILNPLVFFTTDVQFCPNQIRDFYNKADIIFQDCETSPHSSGVHANYKELVTLDSVTKSKMWLYHYQPNPKQDPAVDGFCGFVKPGQEFAIKPNDDA